MNKFYFFFFILLTLIVVSTALSTDNEPSVHTFEKRNNDCPLKKRDVLSKRTNVERCSCTMAQTIFTPDKKYKVKGFMFFAQDECGSTRIAGLFSRGFENISRNESKDIKILIVDQCGRLLYDITEGLNVKFTGKGDSEPFSHKFHEINLDCNDNGILFPQVGKSKVRKRNCSKFNKRGSCSGGNVQLQDSKGGDYSQRECITRTG